MAVKASPGAWAAVFRAIERQGQAKGGEALTRLALVIEKQAKTNASAGAHAYGTKTPATPGSGPAVISGTLRRSITHDPVRMLGAGHWRTRVGTAAGFYPGYGGPDRTASSRYGLLLETGLRNGAAYPFLMPAFRYGTTTAARAIYDAVYGPSHWRKVT